MSPLRLLLHGAVLPLLLSVPAPGGTADFASRSTTRGGLPEFVEAVEGGAASVVFMGGSITTMGAEPGGWTARVQAGLQAAHPDCTFTFRNSGIPSVGSNGHAFRYPRDVASPEPPDLLILEAAVNDLHNHNDPRQAGRGVEGVIRSARAQGVEVLLLDFADAPHLADYAEGRTPAVIGAHERVAAHYQVPSIDFARLIADGIAAQSLGWDQFGSDCHVNGFGQQFYGDGVLAFLAAQAAQPGSGQTDPAAPLDPASWFGGRLEPPSAAVDLSQAAVVANWTPQTSGIGGGTRPGFVGVPVLEATGAGARFALPFTGRGAGLWLIAGPDAARFRWRVDGADWTESDAFTQWSGELHLPWPQVLAQGLEAGEHRLEVEVLPREAGQAGGEVLRVVQFLVCGE